MIGFISFSCSHKTVRRDDLVVLDSIESERLKITFIDDITISNKLKWIPTYNQLNSIDSITAKAIRENSHRHYRHLGSDSIKNYYRQFICSIDSNGDSLVYINAMYRVLEFPYKNKEGKFIFKRNDWQHEINSVRDGGDSFWQILINFSRKRYILFRVNGEA